MYTPEHLKSVDQQVRHHRVMLLIIEVFLFTAFIISVLFRIQWLSAALLILMGAAGLFLWDVILSPAAAYRKFLKDLLSGRKRDYIGSFLGFDQNEAIRDGVRFAPFLLNVAEAQNPPDERLLYYDCRLTPPEWQKGLKLCVSTFDKAVVQWQEIP